MQGKIEDLTGEILIAESGKQYKLIKRAGCGSQGIVYEDASGNYMVKLYYPTDSNILNEDILNRLRFIKSLIMPKNFVSVIDIISAPYVGYVMNKVVNHKPLNTYLIPDKNLPFSEWYNRGRGLYERIFVGYIIAKAFGDLEQNNLSYCDISGNNILIQISTKSASVKMIDVDNIYIAGKGKASVLGTPRYIAPEIINKQRNPDVLSDNYSLAVIIFELLRIGHPYLSDAILDGTPEDEENALKGNSEYVTPENSENMLPEDVVLTGKLKELFKRCFVEGKTDRLCRPSAREFEYALLEASNKLIKCPHCNAWYYPRKTKNDYEGCPWCDNVSKPKARLNFYDILFNKENNTNKISVENKKLINSYILKERQKNYVKDLYILRADDLSKCKRSENNYITIASTEKGYFVYNEFSKTGITIKKYKTNSYIELKANRAERLDSGDEIYFEVVDGGCNINCGGEKYNFIRMAIFLEETK